MKEFEYAQPRTEAEAVGLLDPQRGKTEVLAGGTDLVGLMKKMIGRLIHCIRYRRRLSCVPRLGGYFTTCSCSAVWCPAPRVGP